MNSSLSNQLEKENSNIFSSAKKNLKPKLLFNKNPNENKTFLTIPYENYQFKTPVNNNSDVTDKTRKRRAFANIENTEQRLNSRRIDMQSSFKTCNEFEESEREQKVNDLIESPFKKMSLNDKNERLNRYWSESEEEDEIDPCTRKLRLDLFNEFKNSLISPIKISSCQSSPFKDINLSHWDNIPMIDCEEDEFMQAEQPFLTDLPHFEIPDDF
jgi:hypothetical protein